MRAVPPPSTQSGTGCPAARKRCRPTIVLLSSRSQWDKLSLQIRITLTGLSSYGPIGFGECRLGDSVQCGKSKYKVHIHVGKKGRRMDQPIGKLTVSEART